MNVYFDNAATTPLDQDVLLAMMPYLTEKFGNPSAIHAKGRETRAAIEKARKTIATLLNASPGEIFFTSGGTEANNTAIRSAVKASGIKHIITSPIEHHCVLHTAEELEKSGAVRVHLLGVDTKGRINTAQLRQLLSALAEPALVSLMHANNEIGTMIDIGEIAAICAEFGALFHCDTVQTMAHYRFDLKKTPVHFISGAAHKFNGPKGVGFIYIHHSLTIPPLIYGGAQERNMRAGTENLYGVVGLAAAMERAYKHLDSEAIYINDLKNYMEQKLLNTFDGICINGDPSRSLYTVLNVGFPLNDKTSMLLFNLDMNNICASSGSACSSGSSKGSHVLEAIHFPADKVAVRFSFDHNNTRDEVDYVIEKLKTWVPKLQSEAV
jgi:cysteine desulfurase